jgi:predicted ferric reductase
MVTFNIGKPLGFYALVLILVGVLLSAAPYFKRKIPYHKWINIHKLMGLFYVMAVIHGIMVKSLIQELPITRIYVFGMAFIGVGAWIYRAFLFNLLHRKIDYTITDVTKKGHGITEVSMQPVAKSLQYLAGQFAFFNFPSINKREQHPFTISSHPYADGLRITVKELGDFTNDFNNKLKIGDSVFVEGPYGHFSSRYIKEKEQIWIAGGIGITPFLSLAKYMYTNKVNLFWCVNSEEEAVYSNELETIAKDNPNFNFTIWSSKASGYLTADELKLKNYVDKGYLICGPKTLKENMIKQLGAKGVKDKSIYDEEFAFR